MHINKLSGSFLGVSSAFTLMAGLVALTLSGLAPLGAKLLTSQGSTLLPGEEMLHGAASAGAGITMVVGMLLLLIGLALHALLVLHRDVDRSVPVHGVARKKATVERNARKHRAIEVIWVEQEIRL